MNYVGIEEPQPPCCRKTPCRFETENTPPKFPTTAEVHFRRIYFEALDLVLQCIGELFDQPGYCKLECLLLKAAQNFDHSDNLRFYFGALFK